MAPKDCRKAFRYKFKAYVSLRAFNVRFFNFDLKYH